MSNLRYVSRLSLNSFQFPFWSTNRVKNVSVAKLIVNSKLFSTESKADVIDPTDKNTKMASIFEVIRNVGVDSETITQTVNSKPDILNLPPKQLQECFNQLINNGFTGSECLRMIALYPPLANLNVQEIYMAIESWRRAQFGDSRMISLLRNRPHLLCIDHSEIPRRIPFLKSLSSAKNVANLIKNSPNIMFEDWNEILAKVYYLENVMKIQRKHILNTYALNRSLVFLKTRHVFLDRCGLFTPPKPKAEPNQPNKNPALSTICDSKDEYFVRKVAKLTMEEYEVFKELYLKELGEEEDTYSSDSDSE